MNYLHINNLIEFVILIIIYGINKFSFKDGYPTCKNYVTNTYLYLALSVCYIYFNVINMKKYRKYYYFGFIFGIILLLYMTFNFPKTKEGIIINHLIWFLFLSCLSLMMIPLLVISNNDSIMIGLFITLCIFIIMSMIVYIFPKLFEKSFNYVFPGLLVGLLMVILIELYFIFIRDDYPDETFKYISYFVILLFSIYVSYDTQLMFIEAKECRKYANYPKSSLKFILDVVNIFMRTLSIQNR